jgi:predicted small metal-binding protein
MKSLSCRESGFDCDYMIERCNEQEFFTNGENHAFNRHGMKKEDFIPLFNENLRPYAKEFE